MLVMIRITKGSKRLNQNKVVGANGRNRMIERYSKERSDYNEGACAKARSMSGESRTPTTFSRFSRATPVALRTGSTLGFGFAAIAASLLFSGIALAQVQSASVRNVSRDSGVQAADSIEQALT